MTCGYGTTYTTATNLTTCTPQPAPGIVNCGYIDGTPLTNQDSCTVVSEAPVAGSYSGPARRCDYQTGAFSVTPVTSCTTVPQSPTFASVQKSCAYDAVGTPATNLTSCTDKAQSATSPYEGPNVVCG